jgi:hypothetical protein
MQIGIALRIHVRTKGVWGLRPQPGVEPLHPVLTFISTAIAKQARLRRASFATNFGVCAPDGCAKPESDFKLRIAVKEQFTEIAVTAGVE